MQNEGYRFSISHYTFYSLQLLIMKNLHLIERLHYCSRSLALASSMLFIETSQYSATGLVKGVKHSALTMTTTEKETAGCSLDGVGIGSK